MLHRLQGDRVVTGKIAMRPKDRPRHLPMRLASNIFNNNSLKVDAIEEGPPGLYVASPRGQCDVIESSG